MTNSPIKYKAFLVLIPFVLFMIFSNFDYSNLEGTQDMNFFRKYIRPFHKQSNNEKNFEIITEFKTQHQYPVRQAQATLTIEEQKLEQKIDDQTGLTTFKGVLQNSYDDQQEIPIVIELVVGYHLDESKKLKNTYKATLKIKKGQKTFLKQQFTLVPNLPKPTYIIGCVENEKGQKMVGAVVTASYNEPIYQDTVVQKTDADGCFNISDDLQEFTPIKGDLTVQMSPYREWKIKEDSQYANGFYFVNDLKFKFKQSIVLKSNNIQIDIQGNVKDQYGNSLEKADVVLVCQSNVDKNHVLTLKAQTDSKGHFSLQNDKEFHAEKRLSCNITITSTTNNLSIPYKEQFDLEEEKDFVKKPIEAKVSPKEIKGKVFGSVISGFTKKPVENASIQLKIAKLQNIPNQNSNKDGQFSVEFIAYEGDEYEASLTIQKDQFQANTINKIVLNSQNKYIFDAQTITLTYIPQPIQILIQGTVLENTLKNPINQAKVTILIISSGKQDKIELQTDDKGKFSTKYQAQNTQEYNISATIQGNQKYFAEFKIPQKKIDYNSGFQLDFGEIYVPRNSVQGQVAGVLIDKDTQKPLENAQITVLTPQGDKNILPQQNLNFKTNQKGEFDCQFKAEQGITYQINLNILNAFNQSASASVGSLSEQNNYTIKNFKASVEFKLTPVEGIISGSLFSSDDLKEPLKKGGQFKILSVQPAPLKDFSQQVQNIDDKGFFQVKLQLQLGKEYNIQIEFTYPQLIPHKQVFSLNYQNQYKQENQKIIMGSPITLVIQQGQVNTLTNLPIDKADIIITLIENNQQFKTQTNEKGIFTLKEVVSLNSQDIKAKISVSKKDFKQESIEIVFSKKNNYLINNLQIKLTSELFPTIVQGVLLDENKQPVYLGQIDAFIFDSTKKQINDKPFSSMSDKQGNFILQVSVTYNDIYTCQLSIKHDYFNDLQQEVKLDPSNAYQIKNLQVQLSRRTAQLKYSGVIYNTHKQRIPDIPVYLKFSEDSKKHQATDLSTVTDSQGKFEFQENILVGYEYNGFLQIKITNPNQKDYQEFNEEVVFKYENNYQLLSQQVIMYKKSIICEVSGVVKDEKTQQVIADAQILLKFNEIINLTEQKQLFYTDKQGKFSIKQKIQEGFTYDLFLITKSPKYNDQQTKLQLQSSNQYIIRDVVVLMKQATQFIQGQIKGFTITNTDEYLKGSEIILFADSDPQTKITQKSDDKGAFIFQKLQLVQGNTYSYNMQLKLSDKNIFQESFTQIELSQNEGYSQEEIYLVALRQKAQYNLQGSIIDKKTKVGIQDVFVTIQFLDMLNSKNSDVNSDAKGQYQLIGEINKGIDYKALIISEKEGYLPFTLNNLELKNPYNLKNLNFELEQNNSRTSIYYVDLKNQIQIIGKIYEDTTCSLFPQKNVPFTKVLFYFEVDNSFNSQDILMGVTYTDLDGFFKIKTPHPIFSDIQSYFLFQKEGYQDLKRYLKIKSIRNYSNLDLGQIQILTNTGNKANCTPRQQEIQKNYDSK